MPHIAEPTTFDQYINQDFCNSLHEMDAAKTVHRKLREAQGELTQRSFARMLGVSQAQIARLITAPENMTLRTLVKISRALQVTPSQLLDDGDNHHRKALRARPATGL